MIVKCFVNPAKGRAGALAGVREAGIKAAIPT